MSQDGELTRVYGKGVVDLSALTPQQRIQLTWSLYEAFGAFEFMFHAARARALPDEVWMRWSVAVAWWLTFPGVRSWWHARPTPFTSSFTSFVEATLQDNPSDPAAARRWREFIAADDSKLASDPPSA